MGARVILSSLGAKQDRFSRWARSLEERRGYSVPSLLSQPRMRDWRAVLKFSEAFRLTSTAAV